ncbi:MAG: 50S ribosomal protein L4 [bacterium]
METEVNLYNTKGNILDKIKLPKVIFSQEVSEPAVYESVKAYLANQRLGTACTKNRSQVSGGGKKPWRQKGTGRARAGSSRSPVWKGGGVAFGPKPHSFKIKLPNKVKQKALISALVDKAINEKIVVVDSLKIDQPKTSTMVKVLKNLNLSTPLIVLEEPDKNLYLSIRNLKGTDMILASNLNTYNVLAHEKLLFTKKALAKLENRFLNRVVSND